MTRASGLTFMTSVDQKKRRKRVCRKIFEEILMKNIFIPNLEKQQKSTSSYN